MRENTSMACAAEPPGELTASATALTSLIEKARSMAPPSVLRLSAVVSRPCAAMTPDSFSTETTGAPGPIGSMLLTNGQIAPMNPSSAALKACEPCACKRTQASNSGAPWRKIASASGV